MDNNQFKEIDQKLEKILIEIENQKINHESQVLSKLEMLNFAILVSIFTFFISLLVSTNVIFNVHILGVLFIIFIIFSSVCLIYFEILTIYKNDIVMRFDLFWKIILFSIISFFFPLFFYSMIFIESTIHNDYWN